MLFQLILAKYFALSIKIATQVTLLWSCSGDLVFLLLVKEKQAARTRQICEKNKFAAGNAASQS